MSSILPFLSNPQGRSVGYLLRTSDRILGLILLAGLIMIEIVAATTKGVNAGGDNLFWILATIGLTILFAMRPILKILITNPIAWVILDIILIFAYIIFSAISIVYGVGDYIDTSIQNTADMISTIGGTK